MTDKAELLKRVAHYQRVYAEIEHKKQLAAHRDAVDFHFRHLRSNKVNNKNPHLMAERYQDWQDDLEQQRIEQEREMQEIREEVEKLYPETAKEFCDPFRTKSDVFGILCTDAGQDAYAAFVENLIQIHIRRNYQNRKMGWEAA